MPVRAGALARAAVIGFGIALASILGVGAAVSASEPGAASAAVALVLVAAAALLVRAFGPAFFLTGAGVAIIAGIAIGMGHWTVIGVLVLALVWPLLALSSNPIRASLVALTIGLPLYDVGPIASIFPGVGLLSVVLLAMVVTTAAAAPRGFVAALADRRIIALAALTGLVWLSAVFADDVSTAISLAKTHAGRGLLLPVLVMSGFALLTRVEAFDLVRRLGSALIAVGIAGSALAVLQMAWEIGYIGRESEDSSIEQFVGNRAVGLSEHPNTWASFALIPLALCCSRWLGTRTWGAGLCAFTLAVGIVLTGSRSGWLAVAAIAALGFAAARSLRVVTVGAILLMAAVALALLFGNFRGFVGLGADAPPAGNSRLGADESASFRFALARAEFELGLRHPLLGVGPGSIGDNLETLDADYVERQPLLREGTKVDKHNAYWGLFAELGVLGPTLFALVFALTLASIVRALRAAQNVDERVMFQALLGALAGTAVMAAFVDADRDVFLWWLVGISFGLEATLRRARTGE